jgi:hypothetical protein
VQLHKPATSPRAQPICFKKSAIASHCFSINRRVIDGFVRSSSASARARQSDIQCRQWKIRVTQLSAAAAKRTHQRRSPSVSAFIWAMQSWAMWVRLIA